MKLLLLCGPPRSGKDTIAQITHTSARRADVDTDLLSLAGRLKTIAACAFGVSLSFLEVNKDVLCRQFLGMTGRRALIVLGEALKAELGQDLWARLLLGDARLARPELLVVPDLGFEEELATLRASATETLLVHVHREGRTFDGDSRRYVGVPDVVVHNDSPEAPEAIARRLLGILGVE